MIQLSWFLARVSSSKWWARERKECLRQLFPSLCHRPPVEELKAQDKYLCQVWSLTKTQVLLEMKYPACLILMAYMLRYGQTPYKHAGELVETILNLEEAQAPVWDVSCVIEPLFETINPPPKEDVRKSLIREIVKKRVHWSCKVCLKKEVAYLILDYEHLAFCEDCSSNQTQCPLCHITFEHMIKIYIS